MSKKSIIAKLLSEEDISVVQKKTKTAAFNVETRELILPLWKEEMSKDISDLFICHEIGHALGLSHPYEDPRNSNWTTDDTIMSYNISPDGWDTWFSDLDIQALQSIWGIENDYGTDGNDVMSGESGGDTFYARRGNDLVNAYAGDDLIYANQGEDTIKGGLGDDIVLGGKDHDLLCGNQGETVSMEILVMI